MIGILLYIVDSGEERDILIPNISINIMIIDN